MKKIIVILILTFAFTSVKADDFDHLKLKDINSAKITLAKIADINCDLCGCYLSIDPNYNYSAAGLRYRYREFTGEGTAPDPNTDHESVPGQKENYNTYELWGRYYINPKLQLTGALPVSSNYIGSENFQGIGDFHVQLQYQLFNTKMQSSTKFRNRMFVGGGFKFPTGSFNKPASDGDIEAHFQAGTGSWDFILLTTYLAKVDKVGLNSNIVYKINTANKNGYRFGNEFNFDAEFTYEILMGKVALLPGTGIYFEQAPNGQMSDITSPTDVPDPNSGGNVLFGDIGFDLTYSMVSLKFAYQGPLSQKLNGGQPKNDARVITGIGFSF